MKTTNQSIEGYFNNLLSSEKIELINPDDSIVIDMAVRKTRLPKVYKEFKDSKDAREWIKIQTEDIQKLYGNSVFRKGNWEPFIRLIQNPTLFFKTDMPQLQLEAQKIFDCIPDYSNMTKEQKYSLIANVELLRDKFLTLYK